MIAAIRGNVPITWWSLSHTGCPALDMYLSTLRRYIEAMGGTLEIVAHFPDGNVRIKNLGELAAVGHSRARNDRGQAGPPRVHQIRFLYRIDRSAVGCLDVLGSIIVVERGGTPREQG